jgi:hypothetical protein
MFTRRRERDSRKKRKELKKGEENRRSPGSLPALPPFCVSLRFLRQYPFRSSGAWPRDTSDAEAGMAPASFTGSVYRSLRPPCGRPSLAALRLRGFVSAAFGCEGTRNGKAAKPPSREEEPNVVGPNLRVSAFSA